MKNLIIFISMMLTSNFANSASCPTKEFEGNFKVTQIRGCEGYETWNQVTHVENKYSSTNDDVWINVGFNYSDHTSLGFQIVKDSSRSSSVDCLNTYAEQFWLWFPQSPRKDFFWGFSKIDGEFYLDRGISCSYRLQKI
jgi:hypothetical protein